MQGVGIGDNFAKMRLLLAKRAGYLDPGAMVPPMPGQASQMWQAVSKSLAADSRKAGFMDPMMFLRTGAHNRALPNRAPMMPGRGSLPYALSQQALVRR